MPANHCRCRSCRSRRKLPRHPSEYRNRKKCHACNAENEYGSTTCDECKANLRLQPRCHNCGSREWLRDDYRHRVELDQIRLKIGRYAVCGQCFHYPHRIGSSGCMFEPDGSWRDFGDH